METIQRIKEEISKVVVGQDKMIEGLLYMMDMSRVSLPLNLQVYPLFVMRDRFVQGVISKGLLRGLIAESNYGATKSTISLEELQKRVEKV